MRKDQSLSVAYQDKLPLIKTAGRECILTSSFVHLIELSGFFTCWDTKGHIQRANTNQAGNQKYHCEDRGLSPVQGLL